MVSVSDDKVLCLGFVNGGEKPRTWIVIGRQSFAWLLPDWDSALCSMEAELRVLTSTVEFKC